MTLIYVPPHAQAALNIDVHAWLADGCSSFIHLDRYEQLRALIVKSGWKPSTWVSVDYCLEGPQMEHRLVPTRWPEWAPASDNERAGSSDGS